MEILNRREQIGAKKLPPVIGDDVEKASKSKFGVVKVGDGINVSNGVISIANTGLSLLPVFTGAITGSSNSITFEADLTGKTMLFFIAEVDNTQNFVTAIPVSRWLDGKSASINAYTSGTYTKQFTKTETGLSYTGSDRFKYLEIYAI